MTPDELLQRALERHHAGDNREAAACCRQILDTTPSHREALHLFAITEFHSGRQEMSVRLLEAGLRYHPTDVDFHNTLGVFLRVLGRHADAEHHLRLALDLTPDAAGVWNNLGILLRETDRLEEAITCYRTALQHDARHAGACFNLANALWAQRDLAAAAAHYRRTLELNATITAALAALGGVLLEMERHDEAEDVLRQASVALPDSAQVASDLACVLMTRDQPAEAERWLERAIALNADDARSWYGLGCLQLRQHEYAAAVHSFRESARITPDRAETHHNLGSALCELGDIDQALKHFHKATSLGKVELSLRAIAVMIPAAPLANNDRIRKLRRAWAERFAPAPAAPPVFAPRSDPNRLRIGYLSSFFDKHNWMKPVWTLVNAHNRDDFEIHLFSDTPEHAAHQGYRPHETDVFHEIGTCDNTEVCERMRQVGIDALVDLNAYSRPARLPLLAMRPAPVVAAWFNMYGTSAMDGVDYIVGDEIVAPPDEDRHYTETVIRLPLSYLTFVVDYPIPEIQPPPCLANGFLTFGSLASQYKLTPPVLDCWAEILKNTDARLLLRNAALARESNRQYVLEQFERRGADPRRIQLEGPAEHFEFLKAYDRIDVALDTFPYNGGTTTMEALCQGVPVLTFAGDRWVARTSASLLTHAGLGEFIHADQQQYCRQALTLARTVESADMLAELRPQLRARATPADNPRKLCSAFESFLQSAVASLRSSR